MSLLPLRRVVRAVIASKALFAIGGGLLLWALSADFALAGKRVALVVGNSAYRTVAVLPNPARDAKAIADMFKGAGFDVVDARADLGYLEFTRALRSFEDAAVGAEIAVIYYGGHGIEIGGRNYMVPVDAKLASDRDAQDEAIVLDRLLQSAAPAQSLRLVILDACRDNPFTKKRQGSTRSVRRGLGKVEFVGGTNTLIAYAAKAGSTAEDGDGEHSPFAFALLKNLVIPGLDIRLAFGRVRDDVLKRTENRQEPFVYGSLGGSNISLVPLPPAAPEPSIAEVRGDYDLVERIGTKKAWEVFLGTHKSGIYAELARAQLAKLEDKDDRPKAAPAPAPPPATAPAAVVTPPPAPAPAVVAAKPPPTPPSASVPKPKAKVNVAALEPQRTQKPAAAVGEDAKAWERIKDSSDPKAFREFIERHPQSVLALTAQKHLLALEEAVLTRENEKKPPTEAGKTATPAEPPKPAVNGPAVNTPELVTAAQQELERLGCFEGSANGNFSAGTRAAVKRYLAARGRPAHDDAVTDSLVTDLKNEKARVCPLQCSAGEVAKGEQCIAEKSQPERDANRDRRQREDRSDQKRSKAAAKPKPRQEASSRPQKGGGGGGGGSHTIGVGF